MHRYEKLLCHVSEIRLANTKSTKRTANEREFGVEQFSECCRDDFAAGREAHLLRACAVRRDSVIVIEI